MVEAYHQYSGGNSLQMCHTISTEEAHRHYSGGCAVWTCHVISTLEGVLYGSVQRMVCIRTTENPQGLVGDFIYLEIIIFYRQSYHNLDFIPLRLYPDVAEIPLGC